MEIGKQATATVEQRGAGRLANRMAAISGYSSVSLWSDQSPRLQHGEQDDQYRMVRRRTAHAAVSGIALAQKWQPPPTFPLSVMATSATVSWTPVSGAGVSVPSAPRPRSAGDGADLTKPITKASLIDPSRAGVSDVLLPGDRRRCYDNGATGAAPQVAFTLPRAAVKPSSPVSAPVSALPVKLAAPVAAVPVTTSTVVKPQAEFSGRVFRCKSRPPRWRIR